MECPNRYWECLKRDTSPWGKAVKKLVPVFIDTPLAALNFKVSDQDYHQTVFSWMLIKPVP